MCLICVGPLPDQEICEAAANSNPHGIGIAWTTDKGVEWEKGLEIKDLLAMPDWIKKSCAVHFRLATAGEKSDHLTHPFPVEKGARLSLTGRAQAVLFHNGHVQGWEDTARAMGGIPDPAKDQTWSDSRWLAFLVNQFGDSVLHLIRGQRVLYYSKKHKWMYGEWHQDGDRYYSNTSYKWKKVESYSRYVTGSEWENYEAREGDFQDWKKKWQEEDKKKKAAWVMHGNKFVGSAGVTGKTLESTTQGTDIPITKPKSDRVIETTRYIYRASENGQWDRFDKVPSIDKGILQHTQTTFTNLSDCIKSAQVESQKDGEELIQKIVDEVPIPTGDTTVDEDLKALEDDVTAEVEFDAQSLEKQVQDRILDQASLLRDSDEVILDIEVQ